VWRLEKRQAKKNHHVQKCRGVLTIDDYMRHFSSIQIHKTNIDITEIVFFNPGFY